MKNVNPAPVFYVAETTSILPCCRKAEPLKARTLIAAKREASRNAAFWGTVLTIGTAVDSEGFLVNPVARRGKLDGWKAISGD